jgi:ribonuclease P protein component
MFEKKHRLAKTKDIQETFSRGRSFFNSFFSIKFVKKLTPVPRFTVVVSTKVSKKATTRNRLKRIIREHIRLSLKDFSSGDYIIVVKGPASKSNAEEIRRKLEEVLKLVKPRKVAAYEKNS